MQNMNLGILSKKLFYIYFIILLFNSENLFAENTQGNSVIFGALDKITAKFSEFEIKVKNSFKFGSLNIEVFQCQKRPPEEIPEDFALIRIIDEINLLEPTVVFSGWMLSSSPSLSPLEHPTYDIWIKECIVSKNDND